MIYLGVSRDVFSKKLNVNATVCGYYLPSTFYFYFFLLHHPWHIVLQNLTVIGFGGVRKRKRQYSVRFVCAWTHYTL